jgi:hypothetical protein
MFSTIIEFVLCLKFEFNTLQLLSLTSKDVKDEIDKMRIPVGFSLNKVIKKMVFNIPRAITTRFKIISLDFATSEMSEEYFTELLQLIPLCDALTNLDLRNNQIGSEGAKKLAAVLLANRLTLESPKETVQSPLVTLDTLYGYVQGQCKLLAKLEIGRAHV